MPHLSFCPNPLKEPQIGNSMAFHFLSATLPYRSSALSSLKLPSIHNNTLSKNTLCGLRVSVFKFAMLEPKTHWFQGGVGGSGQVFLYLTSPRAQKGSVSLKGNPRVPISSVTLKHSLGPLSFCCAQFSALDFILLLSLRSVIVF